MLRDLHCWHRHSARLQALLDELGLTYAQYLVLNVLWSEDEQTVGAIANTLALESSTLTPLLKRLETSGLLRRTRNLSNERQVVIALTEKGRALQHRAGCLSDTLLAASTQTPPELAALNRDVRYLRNAIYSQIGGWDTPA